MSIATSRTPAGENALTFGERFLLYMLVDIGPRYDADTTEYRVLVNNGLAERYPNPFTGRTMVRVTEAGKKLHDDAWLAHAAAGWLHLKATRVLSVDRGKTTILCDRSHPTELLILMDDEPPSTTPCQPTVAESTQAFTLTPLMLKLLKRAWKTTGVIILSDDMAFRHAEMAAMRELAAQGLVRCGDDAKDVPGPPRPRSWFITDAGRAVIREEIA